jgi:hypothetical protein
VSSSHVVQVARGEVNWTRNTLLGAEGQEDVLQDLLVVVDGPR